MTAFFITATRVRELIAALRAELVALIGGGSPGGTYLVYTNVAAFPVTGEVGKAYLAEDTGIEYLWDGAAYVKLPISVNGSEELVRLSSDSKLPAVDGSQLTNLPSSGGLLTASIDLTDAQMKSLPSASIEILAAPGVGFTNICLAVIINFKPFVANYTNIDANAQLSVRMGVTGDVPAVVLRESINGKISEFLASGLGMFLTLDMNQGNSAGLSYGVVGQSSGYNNTNVSLTFDNGGSGDLTGGNAGNSFKVTVIYVKIPV